MKKSIITITIIMSALLLTASSSFAQVGFGADVVSRYVWRGTDFGNALSIQPGISFTKGVVEVGAWASYPVDGGSVGANENDLYVTLSFGDFSATVTDYYFPENLQVFKYSDDDGIHLIEASASYSMGDVSGLVGYFFHGDADDSLYVELGYALGTFDGIEASLFLGAGDGMYNAKDDDFEVVNIGISVSKDALSASYILNPENETNFLVFGYSF